MGKFIDLTGKKINRLTVIEKSYKKGNEWYWKCLCDCGKECVVSGASIRHGRTKSCGCLKKESDKSPKGNAIDLLNKKFNKLTVIERAGSDHRGEALWKCRCDCGKELIVLGSNLRSGHTTSCGCERMSRGELAVATLLSDNDLDFIQEYSPFKFSNGHWAKFDFFVNNEYIIEYDGETHYNYSMHGWHNKDQLKAQQERDIIKNQWCFDNNIPIIRIPYTHLKHLCLEDLIVESSKFLLTAI